MMIVGRIEGDLKGLLNDQISELGGAAREAVRRASEGLQSELRAQVRAAGLGQGLEKAWRLQLYPQSGRKTLRPAGLVFSKARRLHEAFDAGEEVTARNGKWLAIPLEGAKALGLDKSKARRGSRPSPMPAKWSNIAAAEQRFGDLKFVPMDGGKRALLVAEPNGRKGKGAVPKEGLPLFLLVRRAKGRKKLDILGAAKKAEAQLKAGLSNILGAVRG